MGLATKQANFLLPEDILNDLREYVPKREQSKVVAEALRKELKRLKFHKALHTSFGAWKDSDHPELQKGADAFVSKLRKSSRADRVK